MDQNELRELENRCIQEEPPECTAACPIHVDARLFIRHIATGNWKAARKALEKTMPLPGILGRICDAPCRERCKRKTLGGSILIGELERYCVTQEAGGKPALPFSRKDAKIAVIGSGLSSLTLAWDLLRKGYAVSLLEPGERVGNTLLNAHPARLSAENLDREVETLSLLGAAIETGAQVTESAVLTHLTATFNAVYLGMDAVPEVNWPLERDENGRIRTSPGRQGTSHEAVFAGGGSPRCKASPVWQAAEGRFAATSIDRMLQRVSMTAGREKEGAMPTRLFTDVTQVKPAAVVEPVNSRIGYTPEEATLEAGRCLQCECLECVKHCVYLERFGAYPKRYAREIYNNDSLVMGARQANRLINSCSLCGLCETLCPENFAMQDLCLGARQRMVERGKMPPSAHEFALLDLSFSESDRFSLSRHEPGHDKSAYAFFPGCQLCASSPEAVFAAYHHLRRTHSGGVGLILGCCGAPAHWAGREDTFNVHLETVHKKWEDLGKPTLILCCPTCDHLFLEHLKDIPVTSLWQALLEKGLPVSTGFRPANRLAVHDPCTARHAPALQRIVRSLLGGISVKLEELPLAGEKTECCGFGGLMQFANPELAGEVARRRNRQSDRDYITYCAMCRDNLAAEGKPILHLLDLIFPAPDGENPALRKRPGWSDRRENRERLKEKFLTETWIETHSNKEEPHSSLSLIISSEVAALLEQRRILRTDIQQVLYTAIQTGRAFFRPDTGQYLASFKPYHVTFWVAYTPEDNGYRIHNAYAHRMEAESA